MDTLLQLPYEQALRADPDNEQLWLEYAELAADAAFVLDRAVARLPASQLLWNMYLLLDWDERQRRELYRRALSVLNTAPGLWLKYLALPGADLAAFDAALFNLHQSHHLSVWTRYVEYADCVQGPTGAAVFARAFSAATALPGWLLPLREECVLRVANYGDIDTARTLFAQLLRRDVLQAQKESLFLTRYIEALRDASSYVEDLVVSYSRDLPEFAAHLHIKLANYYAARGDADRTRHAYTRGLAGAALVRDVVKLFDAFTDWEDRQLQALLEERAPDLDLRLDIFEHLLDRRPFLINDVLLKDHPNLVDIWLERALLYEQQDQTAECIGTLVEAIKSVNPLKAVSTKKQSMVDVWVRYAQIYMAQQDYETAAVIFSRAVKSQFRSPDDLALLYIAWTEMVLEQSDDEALALVESVLFLIPAAHAEVDYDDSSLSVQLRLFKSAALWSFYLDLLRAMVDSLPDATIYDKMSVAYDKMMELRIITLQMLSEYTDFLRERRELDRCSAVYELALRSFSSAEAQYHIWKKRLTEMLQNKASRFEDVQDMFERAIAAELPADCAGEIFQMLADYEDRNGSATRALKTLQKALNYLNGSYGKWKLTKEQLNKVADDTYGFYSQVSSRLLALKDTGAYRETMAAAVQDQHITLPNLVELGLRYIAFETQAKEYRRVRALYKHLVSLGPPTSHILLNVWTEWENFEVKNGTESTIKDMVKTKKSITKEFQAVSEFKDELNPMGFIKGQPKVTAPAEKPQQENPDAIDLDMDM